MRKRKEGTNSLLFVLPVHNLCCDYALGFMMLVILREWCWADYLFGVLIYLTLAIPLNYANNSAFESPAHKNTNKGGLNVRDIRPEP